MGNSSQEDQMILAAWLYYEERLTQEEIAEQLGVSRVAITRLLQRARQEGIVQIRVTRPLPLQYELERQLKIKFDLENIIVVNTADAMDETLEAIGQAGALLLSKLIFTDCRLGMAWSSTVTRIAPYIDKPARPLKMAVNELAGTFLGPDTPYGVSWRVAEKLGVPLESLPVPVVVQNEAALSAIMQEDRIQLALTHAAEVDIALVGLGDVSPESSMIRTGYLTPDQMAEMRSRGAVGDVLMRFYDIEGHHVPNPYEARTISLQWEQILVIPHIVVMACGKRKAEAILGALRAGMVKSLVTDVAAAEAVLGLSQESVA